MLEEARSEPRSRKLPQSDAGEIRDRTTAKESVVRRKEGSNTGTMTEKSIPNSRGQIKRTERAQQSAGRQEQSQQQARQEQRRSGGRGKNSKSDTVKESVAKSKADTMPKAKRRLRQSRRQNSTPISFRGDRAGGDWEVSNRVGSRKQMRRET